MAGVGWRRGFADVIEAIKGTLADASNAGSIAAADFLKLATVPTGLGIPVFVRSAIVDFTVPSSGNVIVPAVAGKYFSLLAGKFVFTTMTGTATGSASGTMSAATGLASGAITFFTLTSFNNMVAIGPPIASGVSFAAGGSATTQKMLVNTAGTFDVVTPATGTGGFAAQGYYTFFGTYI